MAGFRISLLCGLALSFAAQAVPLQGKVSGTDGKPLANCFVATLSPAFASTGNTATGGDGRFTLPETPTEGYLVVQPAPGGGESGVQAYPYQPRLFRLGPNEKNLDLKLPPAFSLVLQGYDESGQLVRWQDFEALGKLGGQFVYATNLQDESIPMTVWPAHGPKLTGLPGGPRETAAPAVLVEPGASFAVNVLFWPVPGYGKLMLRADNGGKGFSANRAGGAQVVLLNLELARTALADLVRRVPVFEAASAWAETAGIAPIFGAAPQQRIRELEQALQGAAKLSDPAQTAKAADTVLRDALQFRDDLEFEAAKLRIGKTRKGMLRVQVAGEEKAGWKIAIKPVQRDFLFGVFEGSPYNARAFEAARAAGFDLATVLFGWNWTDSPKAREADIDKVYGLKMLEKLGYVTKAHGVVWMQAPPILPEKALDMKPDELTESVLSHQQALLEAFGEEIEIWEAMNEPANTNVVRLPRETMMHLVERAAENIQTAGKPVLVNSPHEFSYGSKYIFYSTDNQPTDGYPETFSSFLAAAQKGGKLDAVDILGLQMYPGLHFNEEWGNLQGPAYTPSFIQDTLDRYSRFGKTIHITEFSLPSTYGSGWYNGYWRQEWDEATQADYAERAYTIALAHPHVRSIGWWDIVDDKSSVISGGLIRKGGAPKPVFERLKKLIESYSRFPEAMETESGGEVTVPLFGGEYEITATSPSGKKQTHQVHVLEGWKAKVVIE